VLTTARSLLGMRSDILVRARVRRIERAAARCVLSGHRCVGAEELGHDLHLDRGECDRALSFNGIVGFQPPATQLVGGDAGSFVDSHLTPGAGNFLAHAVGLLIAVTLAGFLYRRQIFYA
jgi:hypothetical protein